jgi:hypothetical protein
MSLIVQNLFGSEFDVKTDEDICLRVTDKKVTIAEFNQFEELLINCVYQTFAITCVNEATELVRLAEEHGYLRILNTRRTKAMLTVYTVYTVELT